jgi:hypothetical protein|tara:strand:- start:4375 stop:5490 length:1116 start_codon:yes stop_codon:yes gene_type:complete
MTQDNLIEAGWSEELEMPEQQEEQLEQQEEVVVSQEEQAEETQEVTLPAVADRNRLPADEALSIGQMAVQSLVMGTNNPYEAAMKVMRGHELGLPPVASMENLFVINGKVGMGAALIGTLIKKSPKYNYLVTEHDDTHCVIEFTEDGGLIGTSSFSMQDAEKAGLVKPRSPWTTYPRNMLLARALSNGARWYCPDAFQGSIYTDEELRSVQVSPVTQPTQQATSYAAPSAPAAPPVGNGFMAASTPMIAEPTPLVREDFVMGENYDTELCPVHHDHAGSITSSMYRGQQRPVAFFKGGRMRAYAHNTGDGWCDRPTLIKELSEETKPLFTDEESLFEFVGSNFPDLAGITLGEYRAVDWFVLRNAKEAETN